MAQKKKKKRQYRSEKAVFHTPEKQGERMKIPMTKPLIALTVVSFVCQIALTVLAVYCTKTHYSADAPLGTVAGLNVTFLYLALPMITWLLTLVIELALRYMPLDMWRMPVSVREGMRKCSGTLLKGITLLIEIVTSICFIYVTLAVYNGHEPSNAAMLIWVVSLIFCVLLPCQKAKELTDERIIRR